MKKKTFISMRIFTFLARREFAMSCFYKYVVKIDHPQLQNYGLLLISTTSTPESPNHKNLSYKFKFTEKRHPLRDKNFCALFISFK